MHITKGQAARGSVAHVVKGVGTFGLPVSYCGRWLVVGDTSLRLCKSCARIAKITQDVEPLEKNEARNMIAGCQCWRSVHMTPELYMSKRIHGEKLTGTEIGMFKDVLSDYANGMDNDACWIGTLALLVKDPQLTQEIKPVEPVRKASTGGGNVIDPKNAKPARKTGATEKQMELIMSLARQMDEIDAEILPKLEIPIATHVELVEDGLVRVKSSKEASAFIERLFGVLDRKKQALKDFRAAKRVEETKANPAEDGFYIMGDTFVTVKWNRAKTGQYATVWNHDTESWEYDGRKSYAIIQDVKAGKLARVSEADAVRFGELYGQCMRCSRELTDPDSILSAMGKTCRSKMGF